MIDIFMNENGDLEVGENGDIKMAFGDDVLVQTALFRLKTTLGDYLLSPRVGADLEQFIGAPNTEFTRARIEVEVLDSLTHGGFLPTADVSTVSVGENEVLIIVEFPSVDSQNKTVQITAGLDLRKGLVWARGQIRGG